MQFNRPYSTRKNRFAGFAAAALFAGLAAFSFNACDSTEPQSCADALTDKLITLTSPTCGQSYKVGSTMNVRWTVKDDPNAPDAVDLQLSTDSGQSWGFLVTASIPDNSNTWGNYPWVVKDSLLISGVKVGLVGKKALVRVMQYTTEDPKKISTMVDPITITAP
jgi:hypothetical protein